MAHALRITGLTKDFGGQRALDAVDIAVEPGEIHALVGHNGSGKSTLVKILAGYHQPEQGAHGHGRGRRLPARLPGGRARRGAAVRPPGPRPRRDA